jgi:predicted acetyltransferase
VSPASEPVLRRAVLADLPEVAVADGRAFGETWTSEALAEFSPLFEPDRFLLATDAEDGRVVGVAGDFPFTLTLPGGARLDVPGVTWVSVALDRRRRGVLRSLLTEQHRTYADAGVALSVLTASEGGIYGRFGYGPATVLRTVEVDRRLAAVRPSAPDPGGVRHVDAAAARALAPGVHERWRAHTPGALSRSPQWWDAVLADAPERRRGASELFHLACPDGWAAYRVEAAEHRCRVVDLFAATDAAHAGLWRALLSLDLVHTVTTSACPPDDPLPFLLADPRQVRTTALDDGMWVRLLDVPAALAARRYATEVDVVLEVEDAFLGLGGRFRLRGGPDGAACERTSASPDVRTGVAALGSSYLGGHRLATLARAGLVVADDPGVLARLDTAFAGERAPQHGTGF